MPNHQPPSSPTGKPGFSHRDHWQRAMICKNCCHNQFARHAYVIEQPGGQTLFFCRRYPIRSRDTLMSADDPNHWPKVMEKDWCSEWFPSPDFLEALAQADEERKRHRCEVDALKQSREKQVAELILSHQRSTEQALQERFNERDLLFAKIVRYQRLLKKRQDAKKKPRKARKDKPCRITNPRRT